MTFQVIFGHFPDIFAKPSCTLPPCMRIIFEVQDLKYATLATVSRCGMIHFSDNVVDRTMMFEKFLRQLRTVSMDEGSGGAFDLKPKNSDSGDTVTPQMQLQTDAANILQQFLALGGLVDKTLTYALTLSKHIMVFTEARAVETLSALLISGITKISEYNNSHPDFPLNYEQCRW